MSQKLFSSPNDVSKIVDELKVRHLNLWWDTSSDFPKLGEKVTRKEKLVKERNMDEFIRSTITRLEQFPENEDKQEAWREKLRMSIKDGARSFIGMAENEQSETFYDNILQVTGAFIDEAKRFNPLISMDDIMQAMRNVWIMNCIQVLLGRNIEYTQSIFAYSMLYPYTDNYLDDSFISNREKEITGQKFGKRLSGAKIVPVNEYDKGLYSLVQMIEGQYHRKEYPQVYESLLCIHSAQKKSLQQQRGQTLPYETDILGISFEKGGTSVLADAYLVEGKLGFEDADFMFGYGISLQLMDDLQDMEKDCKNGHVTVFSQLSGKWKLDGLTNRLFNYTHKVLDAQGIYSSPAQQEFKGMIKRNCTFLLFEAIAQNSRMYSNEYVKSVEEYSPVSFSYLRKLYFRLRKEYVSLDKKFKNTSLYNTSILIECTASK